MSRVNKVFEAREEDRLELTMERNSESVLKWYHGAVLVGWVFVLLYIATLS